jgi:hypothetical protein
MSDLEITARRQLELEEEILKHWPGSEYQQSRDYINQEKRIRVLKRIVYRFDHPDDGDSIFYPNER